MAQEFGVLSIYDSGKSPEESSGLLWVLSMICYIPRVIVLVLLALAFMGVSCLSYLAILFAARLPQSKFTWDTGLLGWIWRVGFYDLEEYIYRGWLEINWGSELELYNNSTHGGRRFPAGPWTVDFLATDKATNELVVIHLKRDNPSDSTVGQLLRHMSWVKENVAEVSQGVRGIIVAKHIDPAMQYAVRDLETIELRTYSVGFQLALSPSLACIVESISGDNEDNKERPKKIRSEKTKAASGEDGNQPVGEGAAL